MPGLAVAYRVGGGRHRAELGTQLTAPDMPGGVQAKGVDHVLGAHGGKPRHLGDLARIGGHTVDLLLGQPGLVQRLFNGVHGQQQGTALEPHPDFRLTDSRYIRF